MIKKGSTWERAMPRGEESFWKYWDELSHRGVKGGGREQVKEEVARNPRCPPRGAPTVGSRQARWEEYCRSRLQSNLDARLRDCDSLPQSSWWEAIGSPAGNWYVIKGVAQDEPSSCEAALGPVMEWDRLPLVAQMVKNLPVMGETWVQSLGQEDSPGEGNGYPLQYSCLKNSTDRGAWQAIVHGVAESRRWLTN